MSLKRGGSLYGKGMQNCLTCKRPLENLKDDVVNTCVHCGQQHYVDIIGKILTLTVIEKPDMRRRAHKVDGIKTQKVIYDEIAPRIRAYEEEIETLKKEVQTQRNNAELTAQTALKAQKEAKSWQQAADDLAHELETLKAKGCW